VPGLIGGGESDPCPVIEPWAFRTGPGRAALPALLVQRSSDGIGAHRAAVGRYAPVRAYRQDVAELEDFCLGAQLRVGGIDFIPGQPPRRDPGLDNRVSIAAASAGL
jgi:hypothetical protein